MLDQTLSREPPAARFSFQDRLSKTRAPEIKGPDVSRKSAATLCAARNRYLWEPVPCESTIVRENATPSSFQALASRTREQRESSPWMFNWLQFALFSELDGLFPCQRIKNGARENEKKIARLWLVTKNETNKKQYALSNKQKQYVESYDFGIEEGRMDEWLTGIFRVTRRYVSSKVNDKFCFATERTSSRRRRRVNKR